MKYDIEKMTETLCNIADVEYSHDLEELLYRLDVITQNPFNADLYHNGLVIIAKVCEELTER